MPSDGQVSALPGLPLRRRRAQVHFDFEMGGAGEQQIALHAGRAEERAYEQRMD